MRRYRIRLAIVATLATLLGAAGVATAAPAPPQLIIPRLGLHTAIGSNLAYGPAFYPTSARPGTPYTIAIAGHRTTHTHPFWALNTLRRNDRIIVVWHGTRHVYRVTGMMAVKPTDWNAVRDVGHERLILSTCTPRFTALERLIVIALPVRS